MTGARQPAADFTQAAMTDAGSLPCSGRRPAFPACSRIPAQRAGGRNGSGGRMIQNGRPSAADGAAPLPHPRSATRALDAK